MREFYGANSDPVRFILRNSIMLPELGCSFQAVLVAINVTLEVEEGTNRLSPVVDTTVRVNGLSAGASYR